MPRYIAFDVETPNRYNNRMSAIGISVIEDNQITQNYFSLGIRQESQDADTYLVASPEKALCDLIVKSSGLTATSIKSLKSWLDDDLRFDMDALSHFDVSLLEQCGKHAPVKNNIITLLIRLVL